MFCFCLAEKWSRHGRYSSRSRSCSTDSHTAVQLLFSLRGFGDVKNSELAACTDSVRYLYLSPESGIFTTTLPVRVKIRARVRVIGARL